MGLLGKKYKTDASGNKVRIADKGYEKEYLKKTKKYIFDMTGKESKATTLAEARKEAGQTPGSKKPVAKWQGYKQDTRIEVPNKETFAESRNIFGGKAGKAKRKRRRKETGDTKLVKVKNAKHAEKLHKKRREAGMTKTAVKGAKDKTVKENFPMSEEDKNYILTGKDRPTEESIKKKVKAAKAKDSGQEPEETEEDVKKKKKKNYGGGHRGRQKRKKEEQKAEKEAKETFKGGGGGKFNKDSGASGGWDEKHKPLQGRI